MNFLLLCKTSAQLIINKCCCESVHFGQCLYYFLYSLLLLSRFEALARAVLEKAWLMDVETCHKAMLSKWTRVKGYNYLDLAFHAHARTFMAHQACQVNLSLFSAIV